MISELNTVVYPGYGVAKISKEIIKDMNGEKVVFYELSFCKRDIKILVPKNGLEAAGVRRLSSKKEMLDIFEVFCIPFSQYWIEKINITSWNRRNKEYQNKIRTGNLRELSEIYRDLKFIEKKKNLSFGEKAVLAQVEFLIAEECAMIMNDKPIETFTKELRKCCEECLIGKKENIQNIFLQMKNIEGGLDRINF